LPARLGSGSMPGTLPWTPTRARCRGGDHRRRARLSCRRMPVGDRRLLPLRLGPAHTRPGLAATRPLGLGGALRGSFLEPASRSSHTKPPDAVWGVPRAATRGVAGWRDTGWRGRIRTFDLLIQSQTTWIGVASRSSNSARRLAPSESGSVRRTLPEESCELAKTQLNQAKSPRIKIVRPWPTLVSRRASAWRTRWSLVSLGSVSSVPSCCWGDPFGVHRWL
jgi:hypothetical protein